MTASSSSRKRVRAGVENLESNETREAPRRSARERVTCERFVAGPAQRKLETKFHLVPKNGWHWHTRRLRCQMQNLLEWDGELPLPRAPQTPCWLLPAKDDMATSIARFQPQLVAAGWKVLTCDEEVIERLSNKARLSDYAKKLGMTSHLPEHYATPDEARYPCLLKAAVGDHGRNIYIVHSREDVLNVTTDGFGSVWLLQELCPGRLEASVSLLVLQGEIVDSIYTEYEYDADEYVWPHVNEVARRMIEPCPAAHLAVMRDFLIGYSGICNFNYKLRRDGRMCIFEVNTRVGADLACDAPRARARALFSKLDAIWDQMQSPAVAGQ